MLVVVVGLLGPGCKPEIGDACSLSTDCSTQGERLCDTTQAGGYCTIFNCEPGRCPEEALCVAFHQQANPAPECVDPQRWSRFQRTFCMKTCESDDDCRGGYTCAGQTELSQGWGASVVDSPSDARVCVAIASPAPALSDTSPAVCQPPPSSSPEIPYTEPASSGGSGGSGSGGGGSGGGGGGGGDGGGGSGGG